jgi:hypothetical protein
MGARMRRALALPVVFTAACSGALPHPAYAPQPTEALVEVSRPPPPARVESVPARPDAKAVWLDGEWAWRRGRWAWLIGRWVDPPPGASFSLWAFVRGVDGSLYYAPGTWRDAKGQPIDPPPAALARAQVESNVIVDADGVVEPTGPTLLDRPKNRNGAVDRTPEGTGRNPTVDRTPEGTGRDAAVDRTPQPSTAGNASP